MLAAGPVVAQVVRVIDGVTVVVRSAESIDSKLRLYGVDTPECGMPFGPDAQRFLINLNGTYFVSYAWPCR